jgi:hypothetical protein
MGVHVRGTANEVPDLTGTENTRVLKGNRPRVVSGRQGYAHATPSVILQDGPPADRLLGRRTHDEPPS